MHGVVWVRSIPPMVASLQIGQLTLQLRQGALMLREKSAFGADNERMVACIVPDMEGHLCTEHMYDVNLPNNARNQGPYPASTLRQAVLMHLQVGGVRGRQCAHSGPRR